MKSWYSSDDCIYEGTSVSSDFSLSSSNEHVASIHEKTEENFALTFTPQFKLIVFLIDDSLYQFSIETFCVWHENKSLHNI